MRVSFLHRGRLHLAWNRISRSAGMFHQEHLATGNVSITVRYFVALSLGAVARAFHHVHSYEIVATTRLENGVETLHSSPGAY